MIKRFQVTDPPCSGSYQTVARPPTRKCPSSLSDLRYLSPSWSSVPPTIHPTHPRSRERARASLVARLWPVFPLEACQSRVTRLCAALYPQGEQTTTSWNRLACDDVRRRRPTTKPGRARATILSLSLSLSISLHLEKTKKFARTNEWKQTDIESSKFWYNNCRVL